MGVRLPEALVALAAQRIASATTVDGDAADLQGYIHPGGRELKAVLVATASGADTDENLVVKMQESPTTVSTDFTDITGAVFTTLAQEAGSALEAVHFRTSQRYVRATATAAGTTPSFDLAVILLAIPRVTP